MNTTIEQGLWAKLTLIIILGGFCACSAAAQASWEAKRHVVVSPGVSVKIRLDETVCVVLNRDYKIAVFVLGREFETLLPKGTKFKAESGDYEVKSVAQQTIDLTILPSDTCD